MTIALKHERTKRDLQRILKIKAIINKHEWKETNLLSESKDWKKFEKIMKLLFLMFCLLKMIKEK